MSAFIDMAGRRVGRWLVQARSEHSARKWTCRCDCGVIRAVGGPELRGGRSLSCGCLLREKMTSHGHARKRNRTPTYQCWFSMIQRCTNKNTKQFSDYGGRGISVCDEWLSFPAFLADMGERPTGLTLDRIDNNGGYNKHNCRWATRIQQQRNTRKNRFITINGTTRMVMDVAKERGLNPGSVRVRLHRGWSVEKALAVT